MFVGKVLIPEGIGNIKAQFELIIVPLAGTELQGQWAQDTDLFLIFSVTHNRGGTFRQGDHYSRFMEKMDFGELIAKGVADWFGNEFNPDE